MTMTEGHRQNFTLGAALPRAAPFRAIAAQATPLLIQAFQRATSDSDKRTLLEKMYVAFGYAGEMENEFVAMQMLARQHPENMDYVLRYATGLPVSRTSRTAPSLKS